MDWDQGVGLTALVHAKSYPPSRTRYVNMRQCGLVPAEAYPRERGHISPQSEDTASIAASPTGCSITHIGTTASSWGRMDRIGLLA